MSANTETTQQAQPAEATPRRRYGRTREAAAYIGSTKSTLDKKRVDGTGPPFTKVGRAVIYDFDLLDEYMEANRRNSTSDPGPDPESAPEPPPETGRIESRPLHMPQGHGEPKGEPAPEDDVA